MMTEFETLVKEMRQAQKDYFRTRGTVALEKSKALERMVDAHIKKIDNPELF